MYRALCKRLFKVCKYLIFLCGVFCLALIWTSDAFAVGKASKVIVFVVDDLELGDFRNPALPHFREAAANGALGLMNTRSGTLAGDNRSSAYLSIGVGRRIVYNGPPPMVSNGLPLATGRHLGETAEKTPLYAVSGITSPELTKMLNLLRIKKEPYLKDIARKNGKTAALITDAVPAGGAAAPSYAALMVADSRVQMGIGNVSSAPETMGELSWRTLDLSDVLLVEFSEMARLADARETRGVKPAVLQKSRQEGLKKADFLLGELLNLSDAKGALLMIVSPMSRQDRLVTPFKNLSPLVLYGHGIRQGILVSNTTHREGLVSNIDVAPSILNLTGINPKKFGFLGEPLQVFDSRNNLAKIETSLDRFVHLKVSRYISHGVYVLLFLVLFLSLWACFRRGDFTVPLRLVRSLMLMVILLPAISLIVTPGFSKAPFYFDVLLTIACVVVVGALGSKTVSRTLDGMAAASIITFLFTVTDLLTGKEALLNTPFGFNDVFSGGRYYGLNNDSMGLLLGASVFGSFYLSERIGLSKIKTFLAVETTLILAAVSLMPPFGANVGGTLAALATALIAGIVMVGPKGLNRFSFIGTIFVVITIEVLISYADSLAGNQTHAGKAITALMSGHILTTMLGMIKSKLTVFGAMLILPPWNVLLLAQALGCYYLYRKHSHQIADLRTRYPGVITSFTVLSCGAIIALIFNDTGIIATALMLTYLTMPLFTLISNNYNLGEYRSNLSQKI